MAEELSGTNLEKPKGGDEFFEVEAFIRETLEESKKLDKDVSPPPTEIKEPVVIEKKAEYKATQIILPQKEQPVVAKVARPAPTAPVAPPSEYEKTFKEYKAGDIVKGTVIKVDPSGVLVDIKYKSDGLILPEELSDRSFSHPSEIVKVGEMVEVYIDNLESKEGYVILSKKHADYENKWRLAYDAFKNKKLLAGKVIQVLKGGLVVECEGIRGFIPASQVSKRPEESLESLKDKTIPVKVIEVDRRQGKIVLSHKMAAGEAEKMQAHKIFDELEVGQVRPGKVSSLKSFGAFVDIGGIEGLIHLSELSWKRVKHPSELLKMGQELDVFVLGVDKISKKVALGLKELQPDPWVNADEYFKAGQLVKAKIMRFAKFGAFAELEHDLEGLIHISEISRDPVQKPEDAVKIGDEVEVIVLRVIPEEQKIGLSIREVILQKEKESIKQAAPAEEKKVTIADMIAQKEKDKAEREAEIEVEESEQEEST